MSRHFHVVVSCCPSEEEKVWRVGENSLLSSTDGKTYAFDQVLTESGGHSELFGKSVSPLIESALEAGHDAFVVAYGLPRTGKTHAVFGPSGQARIQRETRGLVARIGQQVFDTVSGDSVSKISASFCHVFEDGRVMDLFDSRRRRLDVVEDRSNTASLYSVPSLTTHPVCSSLDLARLTEKANLMRNASGGRRDSSAHAARGPQTHSYKPHSSHVFISMTVERLRGRGTKEKGQQVSVSHITVVDLAGHNIGLVQSGQPCPDSGIHTLYQIMTTLPAHGIVAAAGLFPNSSLTKLMKPCLGGNSTTLLIGTVSLSEISLESTKRCLKVLQEAAQIKNYCRHTLVSLHESGLGRTLQQIAGLRGEVCGKVGVVEQPKTWEASQDQASSFVKINGQRYTDPSASCGSLLQKLERLEAQILRSGVSYCSKKQNSVQSTMPANQRPVPSSASVLTKPPPHLSHHLTKPVTPLSVSSSTPYPSTSSHSLSSSSLDSSSTDSDLEVASQPTTPGPPPPPLRGIPHIKPDSTFIPPRPLSNARSNAFRPSSGHVHQHEHSLASSSQVSSVVSGWSEAQHCRTPASPTDSSQSSSIHHNTSLHHHVPPTLPSPLVLHQPNFPPSLRPTLPLQPTRPNRPVGPVRPVLPRPLRPPRPLLPVRPHIPLIPAHQPLSVPTLRGSISPLPLSSLPTVPDSPSPSTPGSLTPNAGSPALTPSPSPSPLQPPFTTPTPLPPSHLPPLHYPPALPTDFTPLHTVAGDNMTSSSSSLSLTTDSDLSQEARDTFDPVIRNRALSMQRTAPPYNGVLMTGSSSTSHHEDAPPYEGLHNTSLHQTQVGERRGEGEGGGGRGDMSEYTSQEEIHIAAMEGVKTSQLKKLAIQYGVDYRDHRGRTPLMYAVLGNQPRMCDTLLGLGAKVNTRDATGLTPLLWATFQAKPQCMKILLKHGADVDTRDSEGRSVFHWAVKSPNIHCLKALQRQATPTIVNTADKDGLTPLHWAVLCNQPVHTNLLLTSTTADITIRDREGRTALTHAILSSSSACIKVILEVSESAVSQRDEKGRTALHYACAEGSTDCVRTLLTARSCDIHTRDNRGTMPLHWAAAANQPAIVQLLLRCGVDRTLRDNDDLTAVEHAEVRGHTECVRILHNYGLRRPSSTLSVASQVSVHATPPLTLDKHGHVTLALPQHRRFSLSRSSLPRPPADGQDHPDDSDTDHTHGEESYAHEGASGLGEGVGVVGGGRRRRRWWTVLMCGCTGRSNIVMPETVT